MNGLRNLWKVWNSLNSDDNDMISLFTRIHYGERKEGESDREDYQSTKDEERIELEGDEVCDSEESCGIAQEVVVAF